MKELWKKKEILKKFKIFLQKKAFQKYIFEKKNIGQICDAFLKKKLQKISFLEKKKIKPVQSFLLKPSILQIFFFFSVSLFFKTFVVNSNLEIVYNKKKRKENYDFESEIFFFFLVKNKIYVMNEFFFSFIWKENLRFFYFKIIKFFFFFFKSIFIFFPYYANIQSIIQKR